MIKALRRKFVLVNMTLIMAVLTIVFGALCVYNFQQYRQSTIMSLEMALDSPPGMMGAAPDFAFDRNQEGGKAPMINTAVFCAVVDSGGKLLFIEQPEHVEVSDDVAQEAVSHVLAQGEASGTIPGLHLRYLVRSTPDGSRIAFADSTSERTAIARFVAGALVIGVFSLLAFFLVSLFLANLSLRPVQQAWNQQRQFVADASHELKTPITVILANTEILLAHSGDNAVDRETWLTRTKMEAMQMKSLVEDMLYLAKADGETRPELMEPLSISDLVWRCTLPFEAVAFERGMSIDLEVAPELSVLGNPGELKQLIGIFLDNACKYGDRSTAITVRLWGREDGVCFSVTNLGPPIPQEELAAIFQRFYRGDKARTRPQGGYGLGLSIAKTIVELHHRGKLTVASDRERGTTFTAQFPVYRG